MLDDLKFALQRLRRSPGFFAVAVLTLAVVVGANTAILSVADAVLFRPLPFKDPDRVFLLQVMNRQSGRKFARFDYAFIDAINQRHKGVGGVGLFENRPSILVQTPEGADEVTALAVSANYLAVLGVEAFRGRLFAEHDRSERAAILSYAAWTGRFGGDSDIVGKTVVLGNASLDVIGVLPRGFSFPSNARNIGRPEIVTLMPPIPPGTPGATFDPIVRLKPGVTREQAQAQMEVVVAGARGADPSLANQTPSLEDPRDIMHPVGRDVMQFLFAAALLVLLVGCANLANMLLARGRRLEAETAIRTALGARRIRIIRPLLIEAVLIGISGSLLALVVTALGFDALLRQVPPAVYGGVSVGPDLRIALMGLALGVVGGILFAAVPAFRAARLDVLAQLQSRQRGSHSQWRIGRPMIAVQVALAVVLAFGSAIVTRAFVAVLQTPLGFDPENVVRLSVRRPQGATDAGTLYRRLLEDLGSRPYVSAVGATGTPPLGGTAGWSVVSRPGTKERLATLVHTLPGYFETIGVRPSAGRTLRWEDAADGGAVLTADAARVLFGGASPLGQIIDAGEGAGMLRVVGVVPAPRQTLNRDDATVAEVHVIPSSRGWGQLIIFVKMRSHDDAILRTLRRDLAALVPGGSITAIWWRDAIGSLAAIRDPRFQSLVLGSFAAIALGLTGLGVFAIVAFLVSNRTREMGIRRAVGAEPGDLVRLVVGQAMRPVLVGLVIGLLSARSAARLVEARFVKLDTSDPWTLVLAGVVVILATALAALLPARLAGRVDPAVVLRAE